MTSKERGKAQSKLDALNEVAQERKSFFDYEITELALLLCHQAKQLTKRCLFSATAFAVTFHFNVATLWILVQNESHCRSDK